MRVDMKVWEVLVPTKDSDGRLWGLDHHQEWDRKVLAIAGGLTLYSTVTTVRRRWSRGTEVVVESMIPVRLACTDTELEEVLAFTGDHYEQDEVIAWIISEYVSIWVRT